MSDFLSKFNKDNYEDLVNEQTDDTSKDKEAVEHEEERTTVDDIETTSEQDTSAEPESSISRSVRRQHVEEDVEIDPDYRKKKRRRLWMIISGSVLAGLLIFWIYYMLVHVTVEDFVDQPVSEARAWGKENDIEIQLEQEHSMEYDANQIIAQSVPAEKKIRKGKTLELTSSLGPDPDDVIPLADFSEMNQEEAMAWIEEHKAENLKIVTEYSDDIDEGSFIKLTINDSGIDESDYRRKDNAALYYSKGEEVFEKDITIPDFTEKPKEEVEEWAKKNEIDITYKEKDSNKIEIGNVISQSEAADEKIAKRDEMEVVISTGKAIVVPNFWGLTPEEASSNYPDLNVNVKQVYHSEVAYGTLIAQSVEKDTKLTEDDDNQVTVTYSLGRPYLKDYRGQLEGDLAQLFHEEYQSKGADIDYIVKYVDSPEVKGTVVDMSMFNEFVPMTYTVEISISNNSSAPASPSNDLGDGEDEPPEEDIPEDAEAEEE